MPYREELWAPVAAPPAFPEPVDTEPADIATIGIGEDPPVGWLARQGDALVWLSREPADAGWRGGVRLLVEEALRDTLEGSGTALDAWLTILDKAPIAEIELEVPLTELYQRIRVAWDVAE